MIGDDVRRVNADACDPSVLERHDQVERVAVSMSRPRDVLNQFERRQQLSESNGGRVRQIVNVHVEIAADDDCTRLENQDLQDAGQLVEERRRRRSRTRSVYRQEDERIAVDRQTRADAFKRR